MICEAFPARPPTVVCMAIATYKDLCIDASDPPALAAFWAPLLGWEAHVHDDGDASLRPVDGSGEGMVWVNGGPEPMTVKNRLHLDLNATSLEPALAGGAVVVDDTQRWTVMRDPDGQLFCVFVRDQPVERPFYELVWDVTGGLDECRQLADWWARAFGITAQHDSESSWLEHVPGAPFEVMDFGPVPEAKTTKNRVHIDVTTADVGELLAAGATRLRRKGEDNLRWDVLADPAGNEFCAFTPD